mgnify:FL=1
MTPQVDVTEFQQKQHNAIYELVRIFDIAGLQCQNLLQDIPGIAYKIIFYIIPALLI